MIKVAGSNLNRPDRFLKPVRSLLNLKEQTTCYPYPMEKKIGYAQHL
jgi:hypothetical protein